MTKYAIKKLGVVYKWSFDSRQDAELMIRHLYGSNNYAEVVEIKVE